jgi:hypothetical protein
MLPDGSGGGVFAEENRVKYAKLIMDVWTNSYIKALGGGGTMLSIVQMYSVIMAQLWVVTSLIMNDVGVKQIDLSKRMADALIKAAIKIGAKHGVKYGMDKVK